MGSLCSLTSGWEPSSWPMMHRICKMPTIIIVSIDGVSRIHCKIQMHSIIGTSSKFDPIDFSITLRCSIGCSSLPRRCVNPCCIPIGHGNVASHNRHIHSFPPPRSVNMGSLGVLLAQKLFASIDMPEGIRLARQSHCHSASFRSNTPSEWIPRARLVVIIDGRRVQQEPPMYH